MAPSDSQQMRALLGLRELLLNGEFAPGERMAEIPLANRLKVSRTPLRVALISLEHEGLLAAHPTRGFIVRRFTLQDIFDTIEIRGLLEGMAGRLAVERSGMRGVTEEVAFQRMKEAVAELDSVVQTLDGKSQEALERYIVLNEGFHQALLDLARSESIEREMQRLAKMPFAAPSSGFVRRQAELPESLHILRIGQDQHHAIIDAMMSGEATRVENLLREHARLSRRNLQIAFDKHRGEPMPSSLRIIRESAENKGETR